MEEDFTQHYPTVRDRVRYHFPKASADDVVQQAYLEAARYCHQLERVVEEPCALLWTIAKRVAVRPARAMGYRPDTPESVRHLLPESVPEPWQVAAQSEENRRLRSLVDSLSPSQARAIKGYYLDGKSCAELAQQYGVSRDAVRVNLLRGRRALRRALGREHHK